ncbi:NAD-dependent succinate-semialdehyde dehydrogenase [Halotalea alkalilenta]|uniref:NAD-dependent succinate-semialdehyde dehydrogenase n=1 Tax=Halotalea alkalilenta TaxID=376489 RepID=UPI00048944A7|nr:NAD-dependent succinate-semialdehyde dehydrogenase [Halotalea alkalilenta]
MSACDFVIEDDVLLLIDGEWRAGGEREWIAVEDPASGETIGRVARATRQDVDDAASAAARGFERWRETPALERRRLMLDAALLFAERGEAIARRLTLEQGKPLAQARNEIEATREAIEWFADEGVRAYGQVIPARSSGVLQYTLRQPVGPVAAFTPWNFPASQLVRKLCAALAAGCSIVAKAAEETPAAPAELVRCFHDAGIPAGVVNLVYGEPAEISARLIPHPAIRKVSFTGSTAVGKRLASLAGEHMKRVTMELGGHAPLIVCDDADIERAARQAVGAKFYNAGQVCIAPTRLLVQERVFDDFVEAFVAEAAKLELGHGLEDGVTLGPLATRRGAPNLEALIDDAVALGARLVLGGQRRQGPGHFFAPSVLLDVPTGARAMNEEPFGPLALINRFATLDDAIAEANRLPYGLAAYAYTRDLGHAQRLGERIESGMLSINHLGLADPELPFGGLKDSGYGSEGGSAAIESYLVERLVTQTGG